MSAPLPVRDAARLLNEREATIRGWLLAGAPCIRRGAKGRGRCALVDVEQLRRWRNGDEDRRLLEFAAEVPALLADALHAAFVDASGPFKRQMAPTFAAAWYRTTSALLDRLREAEPNIPELDAEQVPQKIIDFRTMA